MWSSTISPTNSKKLLIGSTRSVDYVGDCAKTATTAATATATATTQKTIGAGIKGSTSKAQQGKASSTTPTRASTTKISIEMELHIQNKCISA